MAIPLFWLALAGCEAPPTLTVLAAASLGDAFADLERAFEAAHPGVDVVVSHAGSQALATQIRHGIRADVVASADLEHVATLAAEGLVATPRPFATNELVIAMPEGSQSALGLSELHTVHRLVLGDPEVPVGRYADALLDAAGEIHGQDWRAAVASRVVSREPNVRMVAAKVRLGEASAALVYATDVTEGLRAVTLPSGLAPIPTYHHAVLTDAAVPELARAWVAFVESDDGRALLAAHGFKPTEP